MNFFKKQGRALLLSAAAVGVVWLVGCGGGDNPSALVGQWVSMNSGNKVELFKDGTGVVGSSSLSWKTEGNRFARSYKDGTTYVCNYNLSGYGLTQTCDDGEVIVWVKKDKVEEYKKKISGSFTDSRNGQKYRYVKIGGKTWMAENLNYQTEKSWCYGDADSNCAKYGRLYDWNTAKTSCPKGWHLPSRKEWGALAKAVGGTEDYGVKGMAGKVLKSSSGWDRDGNGTDAYGFTALPGGFRRSNGSFGGIDGYGNWWTATKDSDGDAYDREMRYSCGYVDEDNDDSGTGLSVRCVKDE